MPGRAVVIHHDARLSYQNRYSSSGKVTTRLRVLSTGFASASRMQVQQSLSTPWNPPRHPGMYGDLLNYKYPGCTPKPHHGKPLTLHPSPRCPFVPFPFPSNCHSLKGTHSPSPWLLSRGIPGCSWRYVSSLAQSWLSPRSRTSLPLISTRAKPSPRSTSWPPPTPTPSRLARCVVRLANATRPT